MQVNETQPQSKLTTEQAEQQIRQLTMAWMQGWSPKNQPFTTEELRPLYAQGVGSILVIDDFEGGAVVLHSFDEYQRQWLPMMQQFSYWAIQPNSEIQVQVSDDLAVSTFTWVAQARLKDGTVLQPPPSQHGTLVWRKKNSRWLIVHEHLTRARLGNQ